MDMAEALNLGCLCRTLQPLLLSKELAMNASLQPMAQELVLSRPHLFSATPVFLSTKDHAALARSVAVIERVIALPDYQGIAIARAPGIAQHRFGPRGVFMGYDFHMTAEGPRLIEINTNAGGALLNAAAARAHRSCCESLDRFFGALANLDQLDQVFIAMFMAEWRTQRGDAPLRSILIVDDKPHEQYLASEFQLCRELFLRHGIRAVVADPAQLQWHGGALWHPALPEDMPVDLVYNRLTDFYLSEPGHVALRSAYINGTTVVTPHPRAHALHADKRNLITLSNDALLAAWDVPQEDRALLRAVVPATQRVIANNADTLWAQRRQLFFKPADGYGAKAAYRGDKLTRRVWHEIIGGNFVAQALVPPSERLVEVDGTSTRLKLDVRAYVYDGKIQLLAARTYAGQTTNFRTAGGGFSPVVVLPPLYSTPNQEPHDEALSRPCAC